MSGETTPMNRRIYLGIAPGSAGMMRLRLSPRPLVYDAQQMAVLLSRGVLPGDGSDGVIEVQLVSDPSLARGPAGADGLSAYQLARAQGYGGTLTQWLASLVGAQGPSAYDLARAGGYGGTVTQWLTTLVGPKGDKGDTIKGDPGAKGDPGPAAATLLGAVTITQTAGLTVALSAGVRIVQITVPAAWGLKAGDPVMVLPDAHLAGYAAHNAVAVSATRVDLAITAPLLAIGTSFTWPGRLFRLTV